MKIGFIGLGIMGGAMAANLLKTEEVGQPLFAAATINELYKAALAEGLGDSDFAAVSQVIRK